jgi:hypothetical protein
MISHPFDQVKERVLRAFSDFDPGGLPAQKSNGVNSFKRKIAFVGESARIVKSMRAVEFAPESKAIPHLEGSVLPLHKDQEPTFDREMLVGVDDLLGVNPQLGFPVGLLRRTIERPFE